MGGPRLARPAAHGLSGTGQSHRQCPSRASRRGKRRTWSNACRRSQADRRRLWRVRSPYGAGSSRTDGHRPAPGWPTGMSGGRVERRLAAVLTADVAGYSRLMEADEEGTLAALRAIRRDLGDPKIAEHRGRIVKTTGDGLLVEFASVVDAVRYAVEVQRAMAERNAAMPEEKRIEFRIGIHQGDIIVEDSDIFGDGVNLAARLEGLADPGGICVSDRVHADVTGKVDAGFEDIGDQQVKNIARAVRTYRVALGAPSRAALPVGAPLPLPDKPSLAVLPFQNLTGDPEQEYFVDGMVEEIITALSRFRWLFVIAHNSTFTYKGRGST